MSVHQSVVIQTAQAHSQPYFIPVYRIWKLKLRTGFFICFYRLIYEDIKVFRKIIANF